MYVVFLGDSKAYNTQILISLSVNFIYNVTNVKVILLRFAVYRVWYANIAISKCFTFNCVFYLGSLSTLCNGD